MFQLLSYPMQDSMPGWPGSPQMTIQKCLQLEKGDVANTVIFSLYNHMGTHYDAPNHYILGAPQIAQLKLDRFVFEQPLLLEIPKDSLEKVCAEDLKPFENEICTCDLLMIYTGFSQYRSRNVPLYEEKGPGIGSDCAAFLMEHFPKLRAIAVDFVSLASYADQEDGNRTHRTLFQGPDGRFICGIEDVNLSPVVGAKLKRVFALPLMIQGIDSAPVTILAETE